MIVGGVTGQRAGLDTGEVHTATLEGHNQKSSH